jgi:hypothetical protein
VIAAERWENGSEFHWLGLREGPRSGDVPWSRGLLLFSGRDALRLVLRTGATRRGWRRLWVPDYFCQHVVAATVRPDLRCCRTPTTRSDRRPSSRPPARATPF